MVTAQSEFTLSIDGRQPLSAESVAALARLCDRGEDCGDRGAVIIYVSGAPERAYAGDIALVSKWERALRRLERLPTSTIAVAQGDCGGLALDALLVTDYRIAADSVRLLVTTDSGVIWPGMALYRLCHQAGITVMRSTVLFGAAIQADSAVAMGLIDELASDVTSALTAATETAAALSGSELAVRRQLMLDAPTSFEDALGVHLAACDRVLRRIPNHGRRVLCGNAACMCCALCPARCQCDGPLEASVTI
jgi:isomerase DpgB